MLALNSNVDNKVNSITVVPTATKLATARNINGTLFDGSSDILITEPTFTGYLSNYSISDANSLSSNAIVFRYLQSNASNNPTPNNNTIISMGYNSINTSQIVQIDYLTSGMLEFSILVCGVIGIEYFSK